MENNDKIYKTSANQREATRKYKEANKEKVNAKFRESHKNKMTDP